MSEPKFTPGPWHFDPEDSQHDYMVWCDKGQFLANTGNGFGMEPDDDRETIAFDVSKANAALIAAAPDLYAALIETCESEGDDGRGGPCWCHCWVPSVEHSTGCLMVRAALKKARGES